MGFGLQPLCVDVTVLLCVPQTVNAIMPEKGLVIMMPDAVVFHTTSRKDNASTTAFYPIVVMPNSGVREILFS